MIKASICHFNEVGERVWIEREIKRIPRVGENIPNPSTGRCTKIQEISHSEKIYEDVKCLEIDVHIILE